jgi:hypothetical protein
MSQEMGQGSSLLIDHEHGWQDRKSPMPERLLFGAGSESHSAARLQPAPSDLALQSAKCTSIDPVSPTDVLNG